ncbi:MAG TPA: hypothetical protein VHS78_15775 [Candidatus Elarobacter sp.]|jgi:hypothetical protein|nr:hypothetical protein [Candidatus Elarobacter sp.]
MISGFGRRYYAALQTHEGRNKIAGGYLIVAILINLIATLLPLAAPNSSRLGIYLLGAGSGLLIVAIITYVANWKALDR